MVQKGRRGIPFDWGCGPTPVATSRTRTLYVYETSDANADPKPKMGNLLTLSFDEGTPAQMLYRLAQQFPGSRFFFHTLDIEEFQGWREITEVNVVSITENLWQRNQLKVVKPATATLVFPSEMLEKLATDVTERLERNSHKSPAVERPHRLEQPYLDEPEYHPQQQQPPEEDEPYDDQSFTSQNWAKVREKARGVLQFQYS